MTLLITTHEPPSESRNRISLNPKPLKKPKPHDTVKALSGYFSFDHLCRTVSGLLVIGFRVLVERSCIGFGSGVSSGFRGFRPSVSLNFQIFCVLLFRRLPPPAPCAFPLRSLHPLCTPPRRPALLMGPCRSPLQDFLLAWQAAHNPKP